MDRGIKNWMIFSVALVLVEVGRVLGGRFGWHVAERTLDALAGVAVVIILIRYVIEKLKK